MNHIISRIFQKVVHAASCKSQTGAGDGKCDCGRDLAEAQVTAVYDDAIKGVFKLVTNERVEEFVRAILEQNFYLPSLCEGEPYVAIQDDHDGTNEGKLHVTVAKDGDVWVMADMGYRSMRFRTMLGGGRMTRVRTALTILALAAKLDTEELGKKC